jgi:hypothetical protein
LQTGPSGLGYANQGVSFRDYIDIDTTGHDLQWIANEIHNAGIGVTTTLNNSTPGLAYLEVTNGNSQYSISFSGAVATELGLAALGTLAPNSAQVDTSSDKVYYQYSHTVTIGQTDLQGVANALNAELSGLSSSLSVINDTTSTSVATGTVTTGHLNVDAGMYKITFTETSGSTVTDLYGSVSHAQARGVSNSNDVFYSDDVDMSKITRLTITTSGNLSDITNNITSGLTTAGITAGPFFSYNTGPDTITMSNGSSMYHIEISGIVADDLWNGKDKELDRGESPSESLNGTNPLTGVEQYNITLAANSTIEEVYAALAAATSSPSGNLLATFGLDLDWAIDPTSTGDNDYMAQLKFDYNGSANGKKITIKHVTGSTSLFEPWCWMHPI